MFGARLHIGDRSLGPAAPRSRRRRRAAGFLPAASVSVAVLLAAFTPAGAAPAAAACPPDLDRALELSDAALRVELADDDSGCGGRTCLRILEVLGAAVPLEAGQRVGVDSASCPVLGDPAPIEPFVALVRPATAPEGMEVADGETGATDAVDLLWWGSRDEEDRIRARIFWPGTWLAGRDGRARLHLGTTDVYEAWKGFAAHLRHHDAGLRESAARALGALGRRARSALEALARVLQDPDVRVRDAARETLERLGEDPARWLRVRDPGAEDAAEEDVILDFEDRLEIEGEILDVEAHPEGGASGVAGGSGNVLVVHSAARLAVRLDVSSWFGRPFPDEVGIDLDEPLVLLLPCDALERCHLVRRSTDTSVRVGEGGTVEPSDARLLTLVVDSRMRRSVTGLVVEPWWLREPGTPIGTPRIRLVDHGVYGDLEIVGSRVEEGTLVHVVDELESSGPVLRTTVVDAEIGTRFGIQFVAEGPEDPLPLVVRVHHPPIGGRTVDEWTMRANLRIPRFTGWRFDTEHELVPGGWRIDLVYAGEVLASQPFTVRVRP